MSEINSMDPETRLAPPPAPRSTLDQILFGADDLRAGWSLLLFLLLVAGTAILFRFAIEHFHLLPKSAPGPIAPRAMAIGEMIGLTIVFVPSFLMSLIERRPFARYGLARTRMLPDFFAGMFWGFAALSLLIGGLVITHAIAFEGVLLRGAPALLFAVKWAVVFVCVGLSEEFLFRGYLQFTVARGVAGIVRYVAPANGNARTIGFAVAAFLLSICLFAYVHTGNGGETPVGLSIVGLAGAVFAFCLYRTGTLWWAIGMHTAWDWAQSYFYGTPDSGNLAAGHLLATHPLGQKLLSGGSDGPEGSVLAIPTLLLVAVVIHFTLPKRNLV